jgi:hypothetical protein
MKRIINSETFITDLSTGWDTIIEQTSPQYLWEWLIVDCSTPYASLWSNRERYTVIQAVANTYIRRLSKGVSPGTVKHWLRSAREAGIEAS